MYCFLQIGYLDQLNKSKKDAKVFTTFSRRFTLTVIKIHHCTISTLKLAKQLTTVCAIRQSRSCLMRKIVATAINANCKHLNW